MTLRVCSYKGKRRLTEVRSGINRAELRINPVGAPSRMRLIADFNYGGNLLFNCINNYQLVSHVCSHKEISLVCPSAVMEEPLGLKLGYLHVLDIGIINDPDVTGFFDVQHPFRGIVGSDDSSNPWLWMILVCVISHGPGAYNLYWLKSKTIDYYKLRRPVVTDNGILVPVVSLFVMEFADLYAPCLCSNLNLCNNGWLLHPEVYKGGLCIPAYGVEISAGSGRPKDVHCKAGINDTNSFLCITIYDGDLPCIP